MLLFPYSLSFIVTGVVWRWIFNPETGVNVLFDISGLNSLLGALGVCPLHPGWLTDPQVVLALNDALTRIFPAAAGIQVQLGIPLALIPTAVAAAWQLSGFAMAMYLAGLGAIPAETREAARVDRANEWQVYRRIVVPMLRPRYGCSGHLRVRADVQSNPLQPGRRRVGGDARSGQRRDRAVPGAKPEGGLT